MTVRPEMVAFEILRALGKTARAGAAATAASPQIAEILIIAAENVVNRLLREEAEHLATLAQRIGAQVRLQRDNNCAPDSWELVQQMAQA